MVNKYCYFLLIFFMILLTLGLSLFAKGENCEGIVTIRDGSKIPGVTVIAQNLITNREYKTITNKKGFYSFQDLPVGKYDIRAKLSGFKTVLKRKILIKKDKKTIINFILKPSTIDESMQFTPVANEERGLGMALKTKRRTQTLARPIGGVVRRPYADFNTEEYDRIYENRFLLSLSNPLSTFSIDVDTASYSNVRRYLKDNQLPPKDAVRIEEMINYFDYDYKIPTGKHPFSINTELAICPWNKKHQIVQIGIQGKEIKDIPPSNLVFLLDVSGSMRSGNKLPLLKDSFKLLVKRLTKKDRVAIVVYAGAAGMILESTPGDQKAEILNSIDRLRAGGSTAGGAGIKLAYKIAMQNFINKGNNRIILATDGDFNVGISSTSELIRLIEEKRDKGVFLTVLGFGSGNYKGSRMESLADKGNGNYYYIDSILEGKKVFVDEMRSTLFTIAKDVKIQVEFNPAKIKAYRLIGYENRKLKKEDFADDKKDAGELGSGHFVTALYELIPYGAKEEVKGKEELKYQSTKIKKEAFRTKECLTVKIRYKPPKGDKSILLKSKVLYQVKPLKKISNNLKFSCAVSEFGMLLRDSEFKGDSSFEEILSLARKAKGEDYFGYRAEFIRLVELTQLLKEK